MKSDGQTIRKRADWNLIIAFLGCGVWISFVASVGMNAQTVLIWGWTDEICLGWPPARTFVEDPGSWQCDVNALFAVFAIVLFASAAMPSGFAAAWLALRSANGGDGIALGASLRWRALRTATPVTQESDNRA